MTIPFDDIRVRQGRTLEEFEAPLLDVMGASAKQALYDSPVQQLFRLEEEADLSGDERVLDGFVGGKGYAAASANYKLVPRKRVDAETAQQKLTEAGVGGYTVPKEGMTEAWLNTLIKRRQEKAARDDIINRAPSGSLPVQLAASLGASVLDPINLATAFIPVVGQAKYAAMIGKAGSTLGRAGVRVGVGAVEGAVGQAAIEPLTAYANSREGIDYTMADSLKNIAFGSLFGGGLHVAGGAVSDVISRKLARGETDGPVLGKDLPAPEKPLPGSAASKAEGLSPQVSDAALKAAVAQAVSGREIDPTSITDMTKSVADQPAKSVDPLTVEQVRAEGVAKYDSLDVKTVADDLQKALDTVPPAEITAAIAAKRAELVQLSQSVENADQLVQSAKAAQITPEQLKTKVSQQVEFESKLLDAYEVKTGSTASPVSSAPVRQDTYTDLSAVREAANTNQRPEAAQGVDFIASKQADDLIAEAPKTEDLAVATEAATLAEQDLKELAEQLGMDSAKLSESLNEDVKRANSYAKAARAAAVCNLRT